MTHTSGIEFVRFSFTKSFDAAGTKNTKGLNIADFLFEQVDADRTFDGDSLRVLTKQSYFFYYSGKIFGALPAFSIIPYLDLEKKLEKDRSTGVVNRWAQVQLSVDYPIGELSDYLKDANEEGNDEANLFSWIQYCKDDGFQTLTEFIENEESIIKDLTLQVDFLS